MAARFFGRYEHSLDVKGRVILPARFRANFEAKAFVSQHKERCLAVWTPEEFELQVATMEAQQDRSPEDRNLARVWASGLQEIDLDRQGRVPLAPYLREYARLDGQVMVVGALNRVELWDPAEWEARVAPAESALTDPAPTPPAAAG